MRNWMKIIIIVLLLIFSYPQTIQAKPQHYVLEENQRVPIPLTYQVIDIIEYLGEEAGFLNGAEDLFIDSKDLLYVADTQNDRILKMTLDGKVLGIFIGPPDRTLKEPKGIYVDDDGDMYIADTGNQRILHLAPNGEYVEEFVRPESELLGADFIFDPSKVYVNSTGYLYVIKSQAFLSMDANNNFRGFLGATTVKFDLRRALIRLIASEEQKDRLAKQLPASYSNFTIGDDGMIYATVANVNENQIRKITSAGTNIYKEKVFGETIIERGRVTRPYFVDIAVDRNGIISVVDQNTGRVLQYDQEGDLLTIFGMIGKQKGMFEIPSSIVVDKNGRLYVLDQKADNIQVFEPTYFIKLVHEASTLYNNGNYAESREIWNQVLEVDAKYSLAHRGVAKALLKEGECEDSMESYKLAGDQRGYSEAFVEYRHNIFRKYFGWLVLIIIGIFTGLRFLLRFARQKADAKVQSFISGS